MSENHSTKAIFAALGANLGIAIAKFGAFFLSGSASMLSEGIHSLADTMNQILLLVGGKRSKKKADAKHPFGYGRRRFVYGFVVAILLFLMGGVFSLYEGYHKWIHPEPIERPWIPIIVLLISIALEGGSFTVAFKQANTLRGKRNIFRYIQEARSPELPVILLEDAGALLGLCLALVGVTAASITGNGIWDAVGAISIGLLLVIIAVFLSIEMTAMLLGEAAVPEEIAIIEKIIKATTPVVDIVSLKTMHIGPDDLLVAAKIRVGQNFDSSELTKHMDNTEKLIQEALPTVKHVYLDLEA